MGAVRGNVFAGQHQRESAARENIQDGVREHLRGHWPHAAACSGASAGGNGPAERRHLQADRKGLRRTVDLPKAKLEELTKTHNFTFGPWRAAIDGAQDSGYILA